MPRRYSMARRAELSEATRSRIVTAVLDLVREGGAEAIVVSAIAARADVALRTVYYHFPSRGSLLAAALADLARRVSVDSLRAWRDDRPVREALAGFLAALYRDYDELSPWLTPILATAGLPELDEAVQTIRIRGRDHLREILTPSAAELRVPLDVAVAIAYLQTPFPAWQALTGDLGLSSAEAARIAIGLVFAGLFGDPIAAV